MQIKSSKYATFIRIAIFILLPFLLSILLDARMHAGLRHYLEGQIAESVSHLGNMASRLLEKQADDLEQVAGYFRDGNVDEKDMGMIMNRLIEDPNRVSGGILRLDGTAVSGDPLPTSEYIAVQNTFRGKSTVGYREGEGILFTAPVYNGINIKYAIYEFYDEKVLFKDFGKDCYQGQAQLALVDSAQQKLFPLTEETDPEMFFQEDFQDVYVEMHQKMGSNTSAAIYHDEDGTKSFFFVSELEQDNLYLLGRVPYKVVAGEVNSIVLMVLTVCFLLLVLLTIGTFSVVSANMKVRESEELRIAKQVAESASRSKSEFLANMSHELRTPINVILGMDEMILREETDADTKERAMDIKSAAQILLGLINDVLDFSKIESGKMNIITAKYDLVVMIRDLTLLTENRARQKSLGFELKIQPSLPIGLYGDDVHIRQVMTNLLTNAVKYTQEGKVTLSISGIKKSEDTIVLHCEVIDTGIGIKPEDIEKLTVPYVRIEEERNRNVEGTGLGMSIITNLLNMMGSALKIDSVYGKGSTFYFDLEQKIIDAEPIGDIEKRLSDMVKDYEYRVSFIAPKARILVVDDNSLNRGIFVSLLKKTKIAVETASSGKKCLELVKEGHFDLIFMDYLMPEMDGYETLCELKKQEHLCKETPVIALTANAFNGDREKYMEMGFDEFLSKPIVTEKLEQMIREMLPQEYIEETREAVSSEPVAAETEELPAIEGVNWDFVRIHINDRELMQSSLADFYKSIAIEKRDLTELAGNTDTEEGMKDYRIRVHALKSMSAMVGVLSVSELAKLLEKAAKDGEKEKIDLLNPVLMEELSRTQERLRPFMEKQEDKTLLTDALQIHALFEMLRFSMEQMDIAGTDTVMEQIQRYAYEPPIQEIIDRLEEKVTNLDFESAEEEMKQAETLLGVTE